VFNSGTDVAIMNSGVSAERGLELWGWLFHSRLTFLFLLPLLRATPGSSYPRAAVWLGCEARKDPRVAEQGMVRGGDRKRSLKMRTTAQVRGFRRGVSIAAAHHAEANRIRWCVFNNTINLRR
jgi:hypothetical protein